MPAPPIRVLLTVVTFACLASCGGAPEPDPAPDPASASGAASSSPDARAAGDEATTADSDPVPPPPATDAWFADRTPPALRAFMHEPSVSGSFAYPEVIGAGAALLDADGDGDLDLYVLDGGRHPGTTRGALRPNRLFRNDGAWQFTDVTDESGAGDVGYGMGAFAADYDDDGDTDLFVTNVGANVLLRNRGDGTYEDVTAAAGVAGGAMDFSLGATFADLDHDGDLDLYVTNYVDWHDGIDPTCVSSTGVRDYCGPRMYRGSTDRLYLNRGDGTFDDATERSGIATAATRSMGVVAFDADGDGDDDLYVTCDGESNLLWLNEEGAARFVERASLTGCAVNGNGVAEASMGVACLDVDDDGDEDLYATHLRDETHTYYRNDGGLFFDATRTSGLAAWSRPDTGFGVAFFDADFDGDQDLFVANGRVEFKPPLQDPELPYAERNRFMERTGPRTYVHRDATMEPALAPIGMSRAVAVGDLDGDSRPDLLITNNRGAVQLLQNQVAAPGHVLAVRVRGTTDNRDGIGATVTLLASEPRVQRVRPHAGYLSSHDPTLRFGRGTDGAPCRVRVTWPNGTAEIFDALGVDHVHTVIQGEGEPVAAP